MGGFGLDGYFGRVPCPHCGSTDCCGFSGNELICCATKRIVSAEQLRRSAEKHRLATYLSERDHHGWELQIVQRPDRWSPAGRVYLRNEEYGCRGETDSLEKARAFVKQNARHLSAYLREEAAFKRS